MDRRPFQRTGRGARPRDVRDNRLESNYPEDMNKPPDKALSDKSFLGGPYKIAYYVPPDAVIHSRILDGMGLKHPSHLVLSAHRRALLTGRLFWAGGTVSRLPDSSPGISKASPRPRLPTPKLRGLNGHRKRGNMTRKSHSTARLMRPFVVKADGMAPSARTSGEDERLTLDALPVRNPPLSRNSQADWRRCFAWWRPSLFRCPHTRN